MRISAIKMPTVTVPSAIIIILKIFPRKYDAQRHIRNAKQPSASGLSLNRLIISPPLALVYHMRASLSTIFDKKSA